MVKNNVTMLQILLPCSTYMRGRSFLLRCAAFFLMLIFFQKAGAGLFYHNIFHTTTETSSTDKSIGYSCTCIDDYLLPFEESGSPQLSVPFVKFTTTTSIFEERLVFQTAVYSSLRGPPAING